MPYLGNAIQIGDHTGNFKVLDDIKTHTATFDGSASSVVSTTNNSIRISSHRFLQGQRVTYTNGGGGNIGGLTSGTAYFIIFDSNETIKLATNASNATLGTAINLSAVGSGASHTLNVAFDGTNTQFKATTGQGSAIRIIDPVQLNIAINNVVQKPNPKSATLTEGFTIKDSHKIVFATAPSSNEVFWGSLIARNVETFDISDNKIDNFTGDGSTTDFTLSRVPPENGSIDVTIDGVTQHAGGTRSFTLNASVISFTAAPASGADIQVKHIGFAGATTTNGVTGFYGRTGNVSLLSTDNIVANNADFAGDVSIGGVLTYEDVKNVDSVGVITARSGIDVDDFITVGNNIQLGNAGVITATSFSGSGANLTGIDATSIKDTGGNVKIQAQASGAVYTGIHTFNSGAEVGSNIKLGNAGVITATSFSGSGQNLTDLPAGLGTALSSVSTNPLNQMYYTNQVLGVGATITVDPPASASAAYTQYADIKLDSNADLIIAEGDDLIPDVLGLADFGTFGGGASAGRIRVNSITNSANDGAPTVQKGLIITGVTTTTTLNVTGNATISGNASILGTLTYEDVKNVDSVGIVTARSGLVSPNADIDDFISVGSNIHLGNAGVVTATSFVGSGAQLTGIVGGKFNGPAAGILTTSSVGIQTADVTSANLVGAASSLVGLYIGDGSLFFSNNLSRSGGYYITTGVNALNAGPVTLNSALTLDGTWVIV